MSDNAKNIYDSKDDKNVDSSNDSLYVFAIAILLMLVAGFRTSVGNPDLDTYKLWYYDSIPIREYISNPVLIVLKDPGYFILTSVFNNLEISFDIFVFVFACCCVYIKVRGIILLSKFPIHSLIIYISTYFILQEMIQIRAGAASSIFLYSILYLVQGKKIKYVILILLSACFHYSAIVLLPLALLKREGEHPNLYLFILLASVLGALNGVTLDSHLSNSIYANIDSRIPYYVEEGQNNFVAVNVFNRVSIPNLLLCIILLVNFEKLKANIPGSSYIIRIFTISQIIFYSMSGLAIFAFRLGELMGVVGILAWPMCFSLIRPLRLRMALIAVVTLNFITSSLRLLN